MIKCQPLVPPGGCMLYVVDYFLHDTDLSFGPLSNF